MGYQRRTSRLVPLGLVMVLLGGAAWYAAQGDFPPQVADSLDKPGQQHVFFINSYDPNYQHSEGIRFPMDLIERATFVSEGT